MRIADELSWSCCPIRWVLVVMVVVVLQGMMVQVEVVWIVVVLVVLLLLMWMMMLLIEVRSRAWSHSERVMSVDRWHVTPSCSCHRILLMSMLLLVWKVMGMLLRGLVVEMWVHGLHSWMLSLLVMLLLLLLLMLLIH